MIAYIHYRYVRDFDSFCIPVFFLEPLSPSLGAFRDGNWVGLKNFAGRNCAAKRHAFFPSVVAASGRWSICIGGLSLCGVLLHWLVATCRSWKFPKGLALSGWNCLARRTWCCRSSGWNPSAPHGQRKLSLFDPTQWSKLSLHLPRDVCHRKTGTWKLGQDLRRAHWHRLPSCGHCWYGLRSALELSATTAVRVFRPGDAHGIAAAWWNGGADEYVKSQSGILGKSQRA